MCISAAEAEFFGTILYAGRRRHPQHGWIEVFGYQNTAVNLASGPNAMLLHLPAQGITSRQFLDVGRAATVLKDMVEAVRPRSRGLSFEPDWMDAAPQAEVFDHDIYTIVLAERAGLIPESLERVPVHKRPTLDPQLCAFYEDCFPRHTIALCCFDNAEAQQAKPLLLWYRPLNEDLIVLPALDCHTGAVPDLDAQVPVDHWVLFGSDHAEDGWGEPVSYPQDARHDLLQYLPRTVIGRQYSRKPMPNGDFAIAYDDLVRYRTDLADMITRVRP